MISLYRWSLPRSSATARTSGGASWMTLSRSPSTGNPVWVASRTFRARSMIVSSRSFGGADRWIVMSADDHGLAAAVRVGHDLRGLGLEAVLSQALSCFDGFAGVEDVQVTASSAQGDDLTAEGLDEVDVVRLQVSQHQRDARRTRTSRWPSGAPAWTYPAPACPGRTPRGWRSTWRAGTSEIGSQHTVAPVWM